ncbi:MAG: hypothetical protein JXK05_10190 [Campylobacterales bacterium]|nr:hypothetical protein [Campylobacterales bacterium]
MRVLLFNENPVVTKLVTLSAQKAGHTLQLSKDASLQEAASYDLLIVDDALYNEQNMALLEKKLQVGQKLLMANRGVAQPETFDYLIYKPFLPTDLVELLASIAAAVSHAPSHKAHVAEDANSHDALESLDDFDGLDGLDHLAELEDEDLVLEGFDLDQIEADESPTLDLDGLQGDDEEVFEELLDDAASSEGVLDRDEVAELQSLLEDTELSSEEEIEVEGLDDIDGLSEEVAVLDSEPKEELEALSEIDEGMDLSEFEDFESVEDENKELEFEPLADFEASAALDEELGEADLLDDEAILGSLEASIEDLTMDELDVSAFEGLDEEISKAVSDLGEDEMALELDDEMLEALDLDEVVEAAEQEEACLDEISDLDMLDEQSLKRALGESVELEDGPVVVEPVQNVKREEPKAANTDGVEALKALLKALEQQDVARALKGMNITVNISFGATE